MKIIRHFLKGQIKPNSYNTYKRRYFIYVFKMNDKYYNITCDTLEEAQQNQLDYSLLTGYTILTDNIDLPYSYYQKYNGMIRKIDFKTLKEAEDFNPLI